MTVDELERDEEQAERASTWQRLATGSTTWIILILLGMIAVFAVLEPSSFATVNNARNIATNAAILLVVAVGMTFVIITAGIDLSVGSVLVFSGVVSAKAMNGMGGNGWDVILVGLVVAVACGFGWGVLNGVLITKARVPPLIVTLGTLGMALGLALIITDGVDIREVPPKLVTSIGVGRVFEQIPWLVLIAVAVAVIFGVMLQSTRFGRHTYAIGSNDEAARRAGIDVDRHLIAIYAISGLLAGLAGFMSLARFATTTIGGHATDNLQAIAAVVLGGTSLFGGVGTVLGTVVGVFIPAVLQNGFVITGVETFWRDVAVGAVLIAAVYLDQLRRRTQYRD
ncbi:MAG TPA: ABC transporter permease [Solirubrobacteraceae bacterium]|jgi:ribose transport system permease protein|nr:ABC transporter permease [Solirubrobacteraceae bacterium]